MDLKSDVLTLQNQCPKVNPSVSKISLPLHPNLLFSSAGIISAARIHPQLAFFFRRDDFFCSDASPACFFLPQGLLLPPGFIPSLLFFTTGIISIVQIHLYLALFLRRDDFFRSDASLSCSFSLQGLLLPPGFIPSLLFCAAGMISSAQMHLYLALFFRRDYCDRPDSSPACFFHHRDYFRRPDSSLSCSFSPQGLFLPPGFISILLFSSAGIISDCDDPP